MTLPWMTRWRPTAHPSPLAGSWAYSRARGRVLATAAPRQVEHPDVPTAAVSRCARTRPRRAARAGSPRRRGGEPSSGDACLVDDDEPPGPDALGDLQSKACHLRLQPCEGGGVDAFLVIASGDPPSPGRHRAVHGRRHTYQPTRAGPATGTVLAAAARAPAARRTLRLSCGQSVPASTFEIVCCETSAAQASSPWLSPASADVADAQRPQLDRDLVAGSPGVGVRLSSTPAGRGRVSSTMSGPP